MKKIYVASSWRNYIQSIVVRMLRANGFNVYDFRNPSKIEQINSRSGIETFFGPPQTNGGFAWSEIDPNWQSWTYLEYIAALDSKRAEEGFSFDWNAMRAADTCVLVLPCGASAHLEAGYFVGAKKQLIILLPLEYDDEQAAHWLLAIGHSLDSHVCRACGDFDGCHLHSSSRRKTELTKRSFEPELMYKLAGHGQIVTSIEAVVECLKDST